MRCTNAGVSYAAQITPCYPTHSTADAQHVKRLHLITPAVLISASTMTLTHHGRDRLINHFNNTR
jgi:hypothetical protein